MLSIDRNIFFRDSRRENRGLLLGRFFTVLTVCLASSSCETLFGPSFSTDDLVLSTDRADYSQEETVLLKLRNGSSEDIVTDLCEVSLERREPEGNWAAVPGFQRICTGYPQRIPPNQGDSTHVRFPDDMKAGQHRLRAWVENDAEERRWVSSNAFEVHADQGSPFALIDSRSNPSGG
jgi:hypothetical protein